MNTTYVPKIQQQIGSSITGHRQVEPTIPQPTTSHAVENNNTDHTSYIYMKMYPFLGAFLKCLKEYYFWRAGLAHWYSISTCIVEVLGLNKSSCIKTRKRLPRNTLSKIPQCVRAFSGTLFPFPSLLKSSNRF
jgi:hypothetical protein